MVSSEPLKHFANRLQIITDIGLKFRGGHVWASIAQPVVQPTF